jgi:hypothetical protein
MWLRSENNISAGLSHPNDWRHGVQALSRDGQLTNSLITLANFILRQEDTQAEYLFVILIFPSEYLIRSSLGNVTNSGEHRFHL